jgi:hypothetical protein
MGPRRRRVTWTETALAAKTSRVGAIETLTTTRPDKIPVRRARPVSRVLAVRQSAATSSPRCNMPLNEGRGVFNTANARGASSDCGIRCAGDTRSRIGARWQRPTAESSASQTSKSAGALPASRHCGIGDASAAARCVVQPSDDAARSIGCNRQVDTTPGHIADSRNNGCQSTRAAGGSESATRFETGEEVEQIRRLP